MKFIINTEVGDFETIDEAKAYFLDNAASFAGDIKELQ
jgi:hypothetical protein